MPLQIKYPEQGQDPSNIFVGRFQPFTKGHLKVMEKLYSENKRGVVLFLVQSKDAHFPENLRLSVIREIIRSYPFIKGYRLVQNAGIDSIFNEARPAFEPVLWGFGTDREKAYNIQINREAYRADLDVRSDFKGYEIKRADEDVSSTKVRLALKENNLNEFKRLMPECTWKFYEELTRHMRS
jgi:citrate lyase synthetase